jgi:ribosome-binding factor A
MRSKNLPATVISVHMSACLHQARVYVLPFHEEATADLLRQLQEETAFLRQAVGSKVALRYVPELRFVIDETFARGNRIDSLLKT